MLTWEMIEQAVTSLAADIIFGVMVLAIFAVLFGFVFFACLAIRGLFRIVWRWLGSYTWNGVIRWMARKALR